MKSRQLLAVGASAAMSGVATTPAGLPRRLVAPKQNEGGSAERAGGEPLARAKKSDARANGFPPRLFALWGN